MFTSTTAKDGTVSNLKDGSCAVTNDLHNAANNAGRKVRSMFNTASDDISHASHQVTSEIRSNPVRSTVVALGIGALLGALLRR